MPYSPREIEARWQAYWIDERTFRAEPRVPLPTVFGTALSWRAGPGILGSCGPPWAPLAERILGHTTGDVW